MAKLFVVVHTSVVVADNIEEAKNTARESVFEEYDSTLKEEVRSLNIDLSEEIK